MAAGAGTTRIRRLRRIRGSGVAVGRRLARLLESSRSLGVRATRIGIGAGGLCFLGSRLKWSPAKKAGDTPIPEGPPLGGTKDPPLNKENSLPPSAGGLSRP